MRIGVDAACWANGRGYGRFTRELLHAMAIAAPDDEFVYFADDTAALRFDIARVGARLVTVRQDVAPTLAASADGSRSVRDMLRFTRAVWREKLDVFFSPSVYSYFPLPPSLPAVVTVHDAIADRFPGLTFATRRAHLFWRVKTRVALAQARLVLTVSQYAAREIASVYNIPISRIRVSGEAPARAYAPSSRDAILGAAHRAGLPLGARWFAYVGGFNPHKHVGIIVQAHTALVNDAVARGEAPPHLLLIGTVDGDVFHNTVAELREQVRSSGIEHLVRWTGFVPDEELRHLLSGAVALLIPSESEGFGLPAVEAAACATPVIATLSSPLPELLAGGGYFVAPGSATVLTRAMAALFRDEPARAAMGARAREAAAAMSWEAAAHAALGALREVAPAMTA